MPQVVTPTDTLIMRSDCIDETRWLFRYDGYDSITESLYHCDMSDSTDSRVPVLLWPIHAIWRLLTFILNMAGRALCVLLGIAMMAAGVTIARSIVGAPVGIPLASLGFLLLVRALF